MSEYNYEIKYKKGKLNSNVDALSRTPFKKDAEINAIERTNQMTSAEPDTSWIKEFENYLGKSRLG